MIRNPSALTAHTFDVVIVGGGIFGACAAWDAVLRGLSVALIERHDFGGGSSANSYKMVHGGIRYLQHADIRRLRSSCRERSAMLRIAPHLVQPLPIAIPTYGYGKEGKAFLGAGMLVYDLLTLDRNRGISDPKRQVPGTDFLNRQQMLALFPDLDPDGLTGGTVFRDGQMYNPTRLTLAFVQSAASGGAAVANYVTATGFTRDDSRVTGVSATDTLSGETFEISARCVLNAAGPWADFINADLPDAPERGTFSRDACFVIKRRFEHPYALAVQGRTKDPDAIVSRAARHLFVVPWRDYSLIGVWHRVTPGDGDELTVTEDDLQTFIDEINWAYPSFKLTTNDVLMWNCGLVPFGENDADAVNLKYGKESRIVDHSQHGDTEGLVTLIGVRYTMARGDSATAMNLVCKQLGKGQRQPPTDTTPVHGGAIENFDEYVAHAGTPGWLHDRAKRALLHNYGTAHPEVLELAAADSALAGTLSGSTVTRAEVVHGIRAEMAQNLGDVVFRRTDLATGGNPGDAALTECAELVASELGWPAEKTAAELALVRHRFLPGNRIAGPE